MLTGESIPWKIIFDMDGVITGEERYWDAAALTVWELLYSKKYLGLEPPPGMPSFKTDVAASEVSAIRRLIFQEDEVIAFLKKRAINSNWDLAFLTFSFQLLLHIKDNISENETKNIKDLVSSEGMTVQNLPSLSRLSSSREHNTTSFKNILGNWPGETRGPGDLMQKQLQLLTEELNEILRDSFFPFSPFWKGVQRIFQEWYFGEEKFKELLYESSAAGKKGLVYEEEPVLPVKAVEETLNRLREMGWILGIATGRPYNELWQPLKEMGLWKYFHPTSVVTFSEIEETEKHFKHKLNAGSLGKPHPFSFLKAFWEEKYDTNELVFGKVPPPPKGKCWVVGDSLADLLGAKNMGAQFIGVLTGHSGTAQKEFFYKEGAVKVLPDITAIPDFLTK